MVVLKFGGLPDATPRVMGIRHQPLVVVPA